MKRINDSVELDFKFITLLFFIFLKVNSADAKPNYNVIVEDVITYAEYDLIKIHYARMVRFNTTMRVLNASFTVNKDMDPNLMVEISAYEQMPSGRYSMVPMKFMNSKMCRAIKDKLIYSQFVKHGNYPTECPFLKGHYWLNNFAPEGSTLPDRAPGNRWKSVTIFTVNKKIVYKLDIVFLLDRDSVF